jgi:nitroreductase
MNVIEAIKKRRAFRSLEPVKITDDIVKDLAESASLAASCFNKQPWRYIFIYSQEMLRKMYEALSKGNEWAHNASLIVALFSKKESDCVVKNREYYLFDTGMAAANMMLRAVELGLVAHPIAGFDEEKAKEILGIPDEYLLTALLIVGKKSETINPDLNEHQVESEKERPERLALEKIMSIDSFNEKLNTQ